MDCPYCGRPMENGCIENGRGLTAWTPEGKKRPLLFPVVQGESILIGDDDLGPVLGSAVLASLCRDCGKIVIDIK